MLLARLSRQLFGTTSSYGACSSSGLGNPPPFNVVWVASSRGVAAAVPCCNLVFVDVANGVTEAWLLCRVRHMSDTPKKQVSADKRCWVEGKYK